MIHGYLLDTNIFEYWLNKARKERVAILDHIDKLPPDAPLTTSCIVLGEVSYGFLLASPKDRAYPKEVLDFIKTEFPLFKVGRCKFIATDIALCSDYESYNKTKQDGRGNGHPTFDHAVLFRNGLSRLS
jgi:hypothetical protein